MSSFWAACVPFKRCSGFSEYHSSRQPNQKHRLVFGFGKVNRNIIQRKTFLFQMKKFFFVFFFIKNSTQFSLIFSLHDYKLSIMTIHVSIRSRCMFNKRTLLSNEKAKTVDKKKNKTKVKKTKRRNGLTESVFETVRA